MQAYLAFVTVSLDYEPYSRFDKTLLLRYA
jgi:hypothetical protein